MSDLIERLRNAGSCQWNDVVNDCTEAVGRIEELEAEIERLRKALRQVWDCEEYEACPTCKLIAREALEDSDA